MTPDRDAPPPDLMVGAHEVYREGDLLKVVMHGAYTIADMQRFVDLTEAQAAVQGYVLVLVDIDDGKGMSAEVRRFAAQKNREAAARGPIYGANASYGGSAIMRGVGALFLAMIRLLGGGGVRTNLSATEAEARAFLDAQRKSFHAQLSRERPGYVPPPAAPSAAPSAAHKRDR